MRCLQGCGKTVEVLALVLSNPAPPSVVSGTVLRGFPYTKPLILSRCDNFTVCVIIFALRKTQ